MDQFLTVLGVVSPIFTAVALGLFAKRKATLSTEEVRGLQQFAVKFGLPCVVFNACLTAQIGTEALATMVLAVVPLMISVLWAFRARGKAFPYFNLPMLFSSHETGMLGIPLTIILFGAAESYRMGVLDLAQAIVAFPTIAILSSNTGENPSLGQILKGVLASPLLIMSLLGLGLNLSGAAAWMDQVGVGTILTESTGFLAQPVSALMLFSVGYNFSINRENRKDILRISGIFLGWFCLTGLVSQGILCLLPNTAPVSRWVLLLYFLLPGSYLAPGLGRCEKDSVLASGVCSLLTAVTLVVFCVISTFVA
mgnify:CR=1 FL=1